MRISLKALLLFTVTITLFMPLLFQWLSVSYDLLTTAGVIAAQLGCVVILFVSAKQTESRSLKVFWQYMGYALICGLVGNLWQVMSSQPDEVLIRSFFSLFVYFFVFLALETNPHLSNIPLNRFISGRMPAVLFTVMCFSYFVLLPIEFSITEADSKKSILLFHLILTGLISSKLLWSFASCRGRVWQLNFGLLSVASLVWMSGYVFTLNNLLGNGTNSSILVDFSFSVIPVLLLSVAASFSFLHGKEPKTVNREIRHEAFILTLVFALSLLHLVGKEASLFYLTGSNLQTFIVLLWMLIGIVMVLGISYKKRKQRRVLKSELESVSARQDKLLQLNKKLEFDLINSENKAIVGVSNNAILTTTTEGQILSANPAAVQMFQSLEHELVDSNVSQLFAQHDEMHFFFNFQSNVFSLQRKESGISVECTSLRSDGTEFPAQAELQWAEREQQPLIVITFINLSARKLAEKQALDLKDKFIANISHEFRTPLTIINGVLDMYIGQSPDKTELEDLTTAKRNGLRLVRMVEQLLELSRLADNPKLNLVTYRLKTLMAMPLASFSQLAGQSGLTFESHVPEDIWIECDAQAFEKIIFNLLANAVKYTPSGGALKVNVYNDQDAIILDVIDTGIGISKDNQNRIFERFQRADDPSNQAVFGVGIGLSLVNELVKAHGWRISLVSEEGHGSKFSLSLPKAEALEIEQQMPIGLSENEVASLLTEQASVSDTKTNHSQQVVLVIEDNADMQSHIKQVVEQKHHCILAGSGELGLQLAQEYVPDLVVCDLMLTGIDGFEVLKQIKQNELTAHIPVILLTARSDLESRLQGLNLNADEYLSKPFNQSELLTRIQNLIENRKILQSRYLEKFNRDQKEERRANSHNNAAKLSQHDEEQSLDERFLAKLETLIAKYYTEPTLDIALLAKELALSERQLQRKMKVMLDTTPNNFIKEFRLKKAQELLHGGAQIGRIALDVGFSSQTYFGRCFKETYGCTPKQYQQQLSAKVDQTEPS